MLNEHSSLTLRNITISGNRASTGGGMYNYYCSPQIDNSIIWDNGVAITNEGNATPVISFSLVEGAGGGGNNLDADPRFIEAVPAAPSAGGNLRLQFGSPAFNVGNNALLPADSADLDDDGDRSEPLPVDRDGTPRMVDATVDLGAYELQLPSVRSITPSAPRSVTVNIAANVASDAAGNGNVAASELSRVYAPSLS
jgi:hypothetical protein